VLIVFAGMFESGFALEQYAEIRVFFEQQRYDLDVPFEGGVVQGRFPVDILRVHLAAASEQQVDEPRVSAACGHVQQCPCVLAGDGMNDGGFRIQ